MSAPPECRHLTVRQRAGVTIVRFVDRRFDGLALEEVGGELDALAARKDCRHVLLNLTGVEHLPSLMLGKLLGLMKKIEKKGAKLKLCEVGPEIRIIFTTTNLSQVFEIRESEAEALAAFA